jgi:pimeloyl-ACP methyl ester carboxylesterase
VAEHRPDGGGLPLHVESTGKAPGPGVETFLLIHGYGASTFTWRHWAPRLASRGHVLLVDMKGFGRAPKPDDGRYAPEHQAELVLRLIEERGLRRLTLVGHSLGGGVALLVALGLSERLPDRLERLVVVSGAAYEQRLPPFVRLADHPRTSSFLFRLFGPRLVVRAVLQSIVYDRSRVEDAQVRGYAASLGTSDALRALIASARQIRPDRLDQLTASYPRLEIPTLLLWGRHDRVVPLWVGQRLERELPNARLHVLEACGHLPAEELPDESWAVLQAFLDAH